MNEVKDKKQENKDIDKYFDPNLEFITTTGERDIDFEALENGETVGDE